MKPRTKRQKLVVDLSNKLIKSKPITKEKKKWMQSHFTKLVGFSNKYQYHCLECGHTWKGQKDWKTLKQSKIKCPSCNKNLQIDKNDRNENVSISSSGYRDEYNFAEITTVDNFQVIRIYVTYKFFNKRKKTRFLHLEVAQYWILDANNYEIMSYLFHNSYYSDWMLSSNLEIRRNTRYINLINIWKNISLLPIIERNGVPKKFHGMDPINLIFNYNYPKYETLLKAEFYDLIIYKQHSYENVIEKYWNTIKILIRYNYKAEDWKLYFDMIEALFYLKKDLRNPIFIIPDNLKNAHDYWIDIAQKKRDKIREIEERERRERLLQKELANRSIFIRKAEIFKDFIIEENGYLIKFLSDEKDVKLEGEIHGHCVFKNQYHFKKNSLIFSAMFNNKRIETIDYSIKNKRLIDARGKDNLPSKYHNDIIKLFNKNIPKIVKLQKQLKIA